MKELIDKISSYNLFNYLFPGVLFVIFLKGVTGYNLVQDNIVLGVFLYYFIGLVISRFGSLIVEKVLKSMSFIKFVDYDDYLSASDKDSKIQLFSEINNMYRTLISLLSLLLLVMMYELIENWLNISKTFSFIILIVTLLLVFIFSYRKQTKYVGKRVDSRNKPKA